MFCSKCGKQVLEEAIFCPQCGCSLKAKEKEKPENVRPGKKAGLLLNGLLMLLITLPAYLWCQNNRISGMARQYFDYFDNVVWGNMVRATEIWAIFAWIGFAICIAGLILLILQRVKKIQLSKTCRKCFLWIPLIVNVIVMIITYPALLKYISWFGYLLR